MPLTICSRTRVTVRTRKRTPEKNTTASAVRHGTCMDETNGVGEVRVQRHARGKGDWIVGVQPHDQRCYCGRQASCKHDSIGRHSRLRQNLRIHHDDVRHGYESSEAAKQFLLYRGVVLGQMEIAIDQSFPTLAVRKLFTAITLSIASAENVTQFVKANLNMQFCPASPPRLEMLPTLLRASSVALESGVVHVAALIHCK